MITDWRNLINHKHRGRLFVLMNGRIKCLAVVGPTASGKTSLSVRLAQKFGGEVISADSMQIYRGMDIGTAKPTEEEMCSIRHHLIDVVDIDTPFSVSDYQKLAYDCIFDISSRGSLPILCGGTGLYADAVINETVFGEYENKPGLRESLFDRMKNEGSHSLYSELEKIDPDICAKIHPSNEKRIIRALEIYYSTGKTPTRWNNESVPEEKKFDFLILGLDFSDRALLYGRIDKRVDQMLSSGLENEAAKLYGLGLKNSRTASQAIGYKEFFDYFDGHSSYEESVENIKRETRRYAKRQLTWFRRNTAIKWLYADEFSGDGLYLAAEKLASDFIYGDTL